MEIDLPSFRVQSLDTVYNGWVVCL